VLNDGFFLRFSSQCIELAYINGDQLRGSPFVLHDMHAEVLSIRGLRKIYMDHIRFLLNKVLETNKSQESELMKVSVDKTIELKPKSWHLSVSIPPCGSQTNYCRDGLGFNRSTGAKRYHENCDKCRLRYKPGRVEGHVVDNVTSAKRSTLSLSCSDKINLWTKNKGGWMGRLLLSSLFPYGNVEDIDSIYLPSLNVTYRDDEGAVRSCEDENPEPIDGFKRFNDRRFMKQEGGSTIGKAFVAWRETFSSEPLIVFEMINSTTGLLSKGDRTPKPKVVVRNNQYIYEGRTHPLDTVSELSRIKLATLAKEILTLFNIHINKDCNYNLLKTSSQIAMSMLKKKEKILESSLLCDYAKVLIKANATVHSVEGYQEIARIYYYGIEGYYYHLYEASMEVNDTLRFVVRPIDT